MNSREDGGRAWSLRALGTLLLVNSLLLAPLWILSRGLRPHWLALEAPILVGIFMMLPRRSWSRVAAFAVGPVVVGLALMQLADTTTRVSLGRPLNLYLDVRLASAVSNLLRGTLGTPAGVAVMMLAALLAVAAAVGLGFALQSLLLRRPSGRRRALAQLLVVGSLVAVPLRWMHERGVLLGVPATYLVRDQSIQLARMLGERSRFAGEMEAAASSHVDTPGLFEGLGGRDVILAFVESYGMTALSDPRYAPVVRPRLDSMSTALEAAGLHVVSGRFFAPSQGGMSWLGHGSVLSGLWLENQLRYDLLMASEHGTLVDDFEAAGYRTVALMPAITLAWPEGDRFGYDEIYAARDIDYAGPPLNWVTMPDQFTWSFLENTIRAGRPRPLFAEIGLISSHAPWTPILTVLDDWDAIGDGAVFEQWANAGEVPEELWLDTDRVREAYAESVGYAVDVMAAYAARFTDSRTLLIVLGDHQPAPLVTGDEVDRAVPVHVIAADAEVLRPFLEWGFVAGPFPEGARPVRRMDEFRAWFVGAFSGPSSPR